MTSEKQGTKQESVSGLVFVGFLMLGLAAGFISGNFAFGILSGLGVGFVAMAIAMTSGKGEPSRAGATGLVFVGFLMIGLAIGLWLGNVFLGIFVGLGVGFIAMAIARYATGQW